MRLLRAVLGTDEHLDRDDNRKAPHIGHGSSYPGAALVPLLPRYDRCLAAFFSATITRWP